MAVGKPRELSLVKVERPDSLDQQAKRIYPLISGMTRASCVGAVTEKIGEVAGVSEVAVDLLG